MGDFPTFKAAYAHAVSLMNEHGAQYEVKLFNGQFTVERVPPPDQEDQS